MARIVNVIEHPHLVTYKSYETSDYRCCAVCDYKVIIETDDERLLVASAMDDCDLLDFNIDEAIRCLDDDTQNEDWFYPFEGCVGMEDFDKFVNGDMEQGTKAVEAFTDTISQLRVANISSDLRQQLERLASKINDLLND